MSGPISPINVPLTIYGKFLESLFSGMVNVNTPTNTGTMPVYAMLCSNLFVPNQNSQQFKSDISNEIVGSGYFEGGQTVTGFQAAYQVTGPTKHLVVSGGNLVWPSVTFTNAAYLVMYVNSAEPATLQPLIGYMDFGGVQAPTDQAFYVNFAPQIFTLTLPS